MTWTKTLQEQETRMQLEVLEKLPVGVFFIDPDFRVRWVNRLADRQGDFNWKNHYGERCYELHFGMSQPCRGCPTARCLLEEERCTGEICTPGGQTRLITAMPVYDNGGNCVGAVQIATDVSEIADERRQMMESLRQREARLSRFQTVLEGLHSIPALNGGAFSSGARAISQVAAASLELDSCRIWLKEKQGFYSVASCGSQGQARRLGAQATRALAEYEPLLRRERKIALKINGAAGPGFGGSALPKLYGAFQKTGVKAALLCPIKFGGELLGLISMEYARPREWYMEEQNFALALADFTALQITHDQLRGSRRRLGSLLANLPGAAFRIHCCKEKFRFEFISHGCSDLIGYQPAEMLKPSFDVRSIVHQEDLEFYEDSHLSASPAVEEQEGFFYNDGPWKQGRELIFRCIGKDGRLLWLWVRIRSALLERDGAIVHEGFAHDITDRYKLREAEAADKARSEFLAAISHEIRTPMNAILGMTRMTLKTELSPRQYDYIHKVQSAAGTLLGIINDILDFTGMESGRLSLASAPFRVDGVMSGLSSLFASRGREKGLGFHLGVGKDVPYELVGDHARLSKILTALLDNAFKFTEQGEVSVDCRLAEELESGAVRLRFTVEDSGIGMPEEDRQRFCAAFCSGDSSRSRKHGGAGLGLALASRLAEMMDGGLDIQSCPGVGTRVAFTCRLKRSDLDDPLLHSLARRGQALAALCAPPRVILYGQNRRERGDLAALLSDYRLDIRETEQQAELLACLRERPERGASGQLVVLSSPEGAGLENAAGMEPELEELLRGLKKPPVSCGASGTSGASGTGGPFGVLLLASGDANPEECPGAECADSILLRPVVRSLFIRTALDLLGVWEPQDPPGRDGAAKGAVDCQMDGQAGFSFRGEEILLVEDNEINQEIALDLLTEIGLKVSLAGNGLEALRLIDERSAAAGGGQCGRGRAFSLILMDLQMPEMDGFAATRAIRALPEYREVPILAMTAHAFEEEREQCRAVGMDGHLSKPVDAFTLYRALHDNLYGRSTRSQ